MKKKRFNNKLFLCLIILALVLTVFLVYNGIIGKIVGFALEAGDDSTVTRSFQGSSSSFGGNLTVELRVFIDEGFGHKVYVVEETVPSEINIIDAGGASRSGNTLRWADINESGISSTTLTYDIEIPGDVSGGVEYVFSGYYGIDGMDDSAEIGGDTTISYSQPECLSCSDCGSGIFNNCDRNECNSCLSGNCYYVYKGSFPLWGEYGSCTVCSSTTCEDYSDDKTTCLSNPCGVSGGCEWSIISGCQTPVVEEPSWQNTSWSSWENVSCLPNGLMNQSSFLVQYDTKNLPTSKNITFYRYRAVLPCDYSNWVPKITFDYLDFDMGETTNFSKYKAKKDLESLHGVRFKKRAFFSRLRFLERINLTRNINFTGRLDLGERWVYVDSKEIPEFNKSAQITFYNITNEEVNIYRDGAICPSDVCFNISHNISTGIFTFNVNSFSNFSLGWCGDSACNSDESCSTCSEDCGVCSASSGGGGGGGGSSSGGSSGGGINFPFFGDSSSSKPSKEVQSSSDEESSTKEQSTEKSSTDRDTRFLQYGVLVTILVSLIVVIIIILIKITRRKSKGDYQKIRYS